VIIYILIGTLFILIAILFYQVWAYKFNFDHKINILRDDLHKICLLIDRANSSQGDYIKDIDEKIGSFEEWCEKINIDNKVKQFSELVDLVEDLEQRLSELETVREEI
jgi:hypothetical protein